MLQEHWDHFQHFLYRVTATLAVITNFVLIHLILHHSPKSLGTYKYLMIGICLFEVFYEALDLAASPDIYTKDSAFLIVISDKKSPFPVSMLLGINLAYCACFGVSLTIFAVHFVYRYMVLIGFAVIRTALFGFTGPTGRDLSTRTGNKALTVKSVKNIIFWQLIPLAVGVFWMLSAYYFDSHEEFLDRVLRKEMLSHYGIELERMAYVGPYLYPRDEKGKQFINWKAIYGMALFVILISISLYTMAYFGFKSYRKINSAVTKTARSTNYKNLQSQLLLALILQTIIPLTLMHFPAGICFLIPFFESSKEVLGRVLTVSISVYPVIDPLPNMFLVKEYRRALFQKLRLVSEVQRIQSLFSWS